MPLSFKESGKFYEEQIMKYSEVAILMEDIILPKLPSISDIIDRKINKFRAEQLYTDQIGKFCIPILFPLEEEPKDVSVPAPKLTTVKGSSQLATETYMTSNYIEINIPKYILLNFLDIIPKGTKFIVTFIGGSYEIDDIRVIGVKEYADTTETV